MNMMVVQSQSKLSLNLGTGADYATGNSSEITAGFNIHFAPKWQANLSSGIIFRETGSIIRGINAALSRTFVLDEKPVKVGVFHLWKPFTDRMGEHNAGLLVKLDRKRFDYDFGLYQRYFYIRQSFLRTGNYNQRYHSEQLNFMYRIMYKLIEKEDINLKMGIGSFDSFIIQQETNPMFLTEMKYRLSDRFSVSLNAVYLQSGLMNIRVNYYGYQIRGGVLWNL
jgi:hypothetical protein